MTVKLVTIFDLDGVLVDNVDYERAVSEHIVKAISDVWNIPFEDARTKWNQTLAANSNCTRWHDYAYHCELLGVSDAWQASHLAMHHLIRRMPRASEAIDVGRELGRCWLASDATDWVVYFKLQIAGIQSRQFDEVFTLDRCGASKGSDAFWNCVAANIHDTDMATIYVDNRLDRLVTAARTLPNCQIVHVAAVDHPLSLELFQIHAITNHLRVYNATHDQLPNLLGQLASAIGAPKDY